MQMNYEKLLQTRPTREQISWALSKGALSKEYLIYRAGKTMDPLTGISEKCVDAVCTECQREMQLTYIPAGGCGMSFAPAPFGFLHPVTSESIISGNLTICPICGAEVAAVHIGKMRNGIEDDAYFITVGRIEENVVLYVWRLVRKFNKLGYSSIEAMPEEAYVIEKRKIVRLTGVNKIFYSRSYTGTWTQRAKFSNEWGRVAESVVFPWNAEEILPGSTLENSRIDRYMKDNDEAELLDYIRLWQKHKGVETIVEGGNAKLLDKIIRLCDTDKMNLKAKRPGEILNLNREEYRVCTTMKWDRQEWRDYLKWREQERVRIPEDMEAYRKNDDIKELVRTERFGLRVLRVADYLKRQGHGVQLLRDYWRMLHILHEDGNRDRLLPKDLKREHDKATERVNEIRIKELAEKKSREMAERAPLFEKRLKELERYAWEQDGLLIRPAANEAELIAEGVQQNHCVATYAGKMARGETAIFFIRRTAEPDKSYFTLEFDEKLTYVRQNRGKHNCARTKEVERFENKWLAWVKAGCIREERKTA